MSFYLARASALVIATALVFGAAPVVAQSSGTFLTSELAQDDGGDCTGDDCKKDDDTGGADKEKDKPKPKIKPMDEFIKDKIRIEGLFPMYRDAETGAVFLELSPSQFGKEFIYHTFVQSGVSGLLGQLADLGFAGQIQENYVVRFRRRFNQIDVMRQSTDYVVDPGSPLIRASDINNSDSVMATLNIVAIDKKSDKVLVAVNGLFAGNDLTSMGSNVSPLLPLLGINPSLSKSKTSIRDVANYPHNSAVLVEYVFDFKKGFARPASVILQHNFTPMPQSDYVPRGDDPRVGYFTVEKTNLSTVEGLPFEDKIRRWKLEKTDPTAAVSPVKKPITFWIQNSTPLEFRDTIAKAALVWNDAFREAGYEGAIAVKVQPDDAPWKPGDVRYNVIQWIASPNPSFNGYGPSVVNPRTGEILAANIVLEQKSVSRQVLLDKILLSDGALGQAAGHAAHDDHGDHGDHGDHADCQVTAQARANLDFAMVLMSSGLMASDSPDGEALKRVIEDNLYYLVMHEIGHTLGLTHNMKGSFFRDLDQLKGGLAADEPITGSVMDYPATNILPGRAPALPFFPTMLGPYDKWAIAFGYDDRMKDAAYRDAFLARAGTPGYMFGNDAEDMRATGRGIDPRVIPYDMSSDPIGFSNAQLDLIRATFPALASKVQKQGLGNSDLVAAHTLLMSIYRQHGVAISRYVGGIYTARDLNPAGLSEAPPLRPVPADQQKRAMAALEASFFAPDALDFPADYLTNLVAQRRGFSGIKIPNVLDEVGRLQSPVLDHLLHPLTLSRMAVGPSLGGEYDVATMLGDLTRMIFAEDINGSANAFRRNLQMRYVGKLIDAEASKNVHVEPARPLIYSELRQIEKLMQRSKSRGDAPTRAARDYIVQTIRSALDDRE